MIRTRLTDLLEIEHPVMLAGMGGVSYHELVAAVSEAGGIGTLGAAPLSEEQLRAELQGVRAATDRPFGVDLLAALPQAMEAGIQLTIDAGASLFVAGLGVPRDAIDTFHAHGILVGSMCGKVRHAIAAVESGCDLVIAQGTEAGGHTGTIATMPLVPQVVDAVDGRVPVVAAGGIVDGRGLAAALALGADGVWVGTRFIATHEARTVAGYREALLRTPEDGTVVSKGYSGKPMRTVRSEWTQHYEDHPEDLRPFPEQLLVSISQGALHLGGDEATEVDPARECYPAGQGVGALHEVVPAGEVVHRMVADAEAVLDRIGGLTR